MAEDSGIKAPLKTVAEGSMFVFAGMFVAKALHYLFRLMVARFLGPGEYGVFSLAFSVFTVAMLFSTIGLPTATNRFVSKHLGRGDHKRVRGTIRATFEMSVPLSLLVGGGMFLLAPFLGTAVFQEPGTVPVIRIFAVMVPLRTFLNNVLETFKAFKRMDYYAGVDHVLQSVVLILLTGVLLYSGFGVIGAAAAWVLSSATAAAIGFYLLQGRLCSVFHGAGTRNHWEMLVFALPLFGVGVSDVVSGHAANLLMGWLPATTATDIGVYNAALPTSEIVGGFQIFGLILFPVITSHLARGEEKLARDITNVTMRWTVIAMLPVVTMLVLFARPVLRLVFGPAYIAGATALTIMAVGTFFHVLVNPITLHLPARDKTMWMLLNNLATAVVNIGLTYLFIPLFGIEGAAIAVSLSLILGAALPVVEAVIFLNVRPRLEGFLPPFVAAAAAGSLAVIVAERLFASLSLLELLVTGFLFIVVYALVFLLMGGMQEEDAVVMEVVEDRSGYDLGRVKSFVRRLSGDTDERA